MERALQRDQREAFWVRARQLAPEVHVSVARYFSSELQERVENAMQVAVMLLCFWAGAVLTTGAATYRATERSRAVHAEVIRIIRGSTKERLSTDDPSIYVEQLIEAGNTILEHVESLVVGVRTVSDNIAHDLRTPLTRLRNKLSQLRQQVDSSHIQQIDQILSDCDDLLTSFNALLRISLLEVGSQLPADGQLVSLRKVLQDVVEMYEPVAHKAGVLLSFHSEYVDQMIGEPDLLGQMFANLIDNAIKYTPPGGSIFVTLERDSPKWLRVLVSDNGRGIPEGERANVFRRFYRGEPSRGESKGHGLGLSLVQAIVLYHRGSIVLSDNNPGLRVSVLLPVALESKSRVGAQGVR
jgi:signal transduction histidine kinase